ncbi:putative methyltransferase [Diplogelasinospora grovesii]|uniref:Methyltransferase n=1 Tax=Diplogelasinospora grovesii TaxID=303347 RepID=A0AAN6MZN9_9PEZI|nr:putative methyltransferase [Diplogelasinospora grovesii]
MATENKDHWSSEAYQQSASFVPQLATKIVQWLDPHEYASVLDVGCGDGVLSLEIASKLGIGCLYGIDSSPAMIKAARENDARKNRHSTNCTFKVMDARDIMSQAGWRVDRENYRENICSTVGSFTFDKVFSNAALHWILGSASSDEERAGIFRGIRDVTIIGGCFAFEMGGLGNVAEMRTALLMAIARRVGLAKARAADPWFFPDEEWMRHMLEDRVGGWKVEKMEREWRPTTATDKGGVEGWIRLMGAQFFDALDPGQHDREECIKEVVDVLETVCAKPGGGYMLSYVRLRVLARRLPVGSGNPEDPCAFCGRQG